MNRQRKGFLLKFLVFLFALNTISLFFYFSSLFIHHPPSTNNHPTQIPLHTKNNNNIYFRGKPWPILPSYLPWTPLNPNIPSKSCEAYFGNGFNRRIDLLPSSSSSSLDGWFRCFYSESLQSSICEGGRMRMDTDKIKMSMGGEKLESVIGRSEEDELPIFDFGAFQIQHHNGNRKNKLVNDQFLDQFVPNGRIHMHTMRSLIDSVQLVASDQFNCSQTPLEETWEALFSSVRYAKNFSGSVCFRHAILSPLGYETALFQGLSEAINCEGTTAHELWEHPDNSKTARLSEFGEMIRAAFGYPVDRNRGVPKPVSSGVYNILFVRREDYLAHPRHGGKVESRLTNEQQVFDALKTWLSDSKNVKCKTNLVNGLFAHMSMKEQVRAIQDASIIIGAHGAGLTHIVSATPNTVILEIISSLFRRPHFALISQWKGLKYHAINLQGSYAEPQTVIDQLSSILKNLGC
ncbi:glycoprotein 2-beta-D-xylosyltransferase [Ranunculus cassubicifolius]